MQMKVIHKLSSYHDLLAAPGSLIAGFVTYLVLSLLLIPIRITIPEAILISILVFGLTEYYAAPNKKSIQVRRMEENDSYQINDNSDHFVIDNTNNIPIKDFLFVSFYLMLLVVAVFLPHFELQIFKPWNEFSLVNIIQLIIGVAFCFFLPGYAVIATVDNAHKLRPILRALLAYILSMFFSGFTGYILASLGLPLLEMRFIFIIVYALTLIPFAVVSFWGLSFFRKKNINTSFPQTIKKLLSRLLRKIKERISVLLIFGSLLALVILSTYSLYGGIIIGDQWFHHGRSLTVINGSYNRLASSGVEEIYPPFLSALLAVFFTLSGNIPSVNTYVSIGFLNIVPVLAFYYFFTNWISWPHLRGAAILASVLFLLSSGFGWVFALDLVSNHPLTSPLSALQTLYTASKQTFDIRTPSTFILASHPDFSTGIQLIVLPIGFVLLGFVKEVGKSRQIKLSAIVFVITTLAILSHDEIYLFIIIVTILPLAFRSPNKDFLYIGFLCSILFTVLLDTLFPGRYSVSEFFGLPLQGLCILLVVLTWLLYNSNKLFRKLPNLKISLPKKVPTSHLMFLLGIALVITAAFLYIFSYIVWGGLSFKEIQLHISTNNVPWYLYPFKMGIMGVLGLAFVLSYVFRKFEKEVFVFGIITLVALFLGPYYDEHRFSKYVMVGMVGFASLLVYEIILYIKRSHFNPLFTGILIGSIIALSSISTLLFIGYHALALDTGRLDLALGRRDFPSFSQIKVFSFLDRGNAGNNNSDSSNVITFANEYNTQHGLLGKLQGFSGIPIPLLLKQPLTLNSSTLEGLYSHLASSDSRYILLPKPDTHRDKGEREDFSNILKFAYTHFQRVYEDDNFIILLVPDLLAQASSTGDVALLYDRTGFLSSPAISGNKITLPFNVSSFDNLNNSEFVKSKQNKDSVVLYGDKKSHTLWSKRLEQQSKNQSFNYIESTFQFSGKNETKTHNDCGIMWDDGKKKYYTYLRDDKLGFTETPAPEKQFVPENEELKWQKGIWYTLKIIIDKGSINVYVDDSLKLQIPRATIGDNLISKVGIKCSGGIAEFEPIQLAANSGISNKSFQQKYDIFHHFYPLSALALSNLSYESFLDDDSSAYTMKNVLLTHDPSNQEDINKYLEVVRRGGTLIVMNTNDTSHEGGFSKLLGLRQGNYTEFDSIAREGNNNTSKRNHIEVSGFASEIDINPKLKDVSIISNYLRNNQSIAPFAIEKKYLDTGGRIIFVNIAGYFDTLYKSPRKYFSGLGNIPELVNVDTGKNSHEKRTEDSISAARYVGNLTASGHAIINSSSLHFLDNSNNTYAEEISISNEDDNQNDYGKPVEKVIDKKVPLKDIQLYGQYKAIITSYGVTSMPSTYSPSSQLDYVAVSIPTRSNIIIQFYNGSRVQVESGNLTKQYTFRDNESVTFQNIQANTRDVDSFMVLVKKPEFSVIGNASFEALYRGLDDFYLTKDVFGVPVELSNVKLKAALDQVDNYEVAGSRGKKTNYLTYLSSLDIDENRTHEIDLKIPGDISDRAKAEGMVIPWEKIIISYSSIATYSILSVGALLTFLLWKRLSARSETA